MYELTIRALFSAAHNLRNYRGTCERLHGHNYKVEIALQTESLDKTGMAMDFKKAKKILHTIISKLDHQYLNKIAWFKKRNPTAENIARFFYEEVSGKLKKNIRLSYVKVWESPGCAAKYFE